MEYHRDELTDETNDNNGPNKNVINSKSKKTKLDLDCHRTQSTKKRNVQLEGAILSRKENLPRSEI